MTLSGLLVFVLAYAAAVASPGPGVAAIVARALARGLRGMGFFIAGFVAGDLVWFTIAAAGLALLAQSFHAIFLLIKYAGAAYLLYLAYRFWTAPAEGAELTRNARSEGGVRLFLAGLSLTLGNPKVMVFFLALLPTIVDLGRLTPLNFVEIGACSVVILNLVLWGYALAAARARSLLSSARVVRMVNRGSSAVMAGAALAVATR